MIAALLVVLFPYAGNSAQADVIDLPAPSNGCLAAVSGAAGMYEGTVTPATGIELDVAGPVVQVVIEWMGIWDADPADPSIGVDVTGPGGVISNPSVSGTLAAKDSTRIDGVTSPFTFAYWSDITAEFGSGAAGTYTVELTPPLDAVAANANHWWGASVTVVYDTTPCDQTSEVIWKIGADYYFGGSGVDSPGTTDLIVYELGAPLTSELLVTVRSNHGGADSKTESCRVSTVWVATGSGAAPAVTDDLVDLDGNVVFPGAVEGVIDPFTPPNQPCPPPTVSAPVQAVRGGNVGPQFAQIEIDVLVPAGAEWIAFQLESPGDNGGLPGRPESGAWGGGGVLVVPVALSEPAITLEKTVLDGHGVACPGTETADELVVTTLGAPVTYCFRVTNTGETALFPVTVDDPDLGITNTDMTLVSGDDTVPLLAGEELVYSYETTATADLVNVATAEGVPTDDEGTPIDDLDPVTDTNDAAVDVLGADVLLEKTVLEGHGASCPGIEGTDELVVGIPGTPVTYCFRAINTGELALFPLTIGDPDLGITDADMTLVSGDPTTTVDPGDEVVWAYETTLDTNLVNTAVATGQPLDPDAGPIAIPAALDPVTDSNDAQVALLGPAIAIEKTVLAGSATCPGTQGVDELATGLVGAPVTYCFQVTNTGTVPLFPVVIDDPDLGITDANMTLVSGDPSSPLLPAGTIVYEFETTIASDLVNVATTTGTASDDNGDPLDPTTTVTDSDDAAVESISPGLLLEKTVVAGHGAACPAAEGTDELVEGELGDPITYCFRVVNVGNVALTSVELTDVTLGVVDDAMTLISGDPTQPLQPGEEIIYAYETTITGDMVNEAFVTGMPSTGGGIVLDPASTLSDDNDAEVREIEEQLPVTGPASGRQAGFGFVLLAAGAGLVTWTQRRIRLSAQGAIR